MWPNLQLPTDLVTFTEEILTGCVRYTFASLFYSLKESTCETKKNVFFISLQKRFSFLR